MLHEPRPTPPIETPRHDVQSIDITNPDTQREIIFSQDPRILRVVNALAMKIQSCPPAPQYPNESPSALIVGGFVRDALLNKKPNDADVEVYGMTADRLESLLDQLYPGRVGKVGRSFGIFSITEDGVDLDISLPRRTSIMEEGSQLVDGDPTMSVKEAARRRDFTFNGFAADVLTGTIHDPFNGIADLQTHTLRVTDPVRFQDDPLRILRGMQFAARMELTAEPKTLALMKQMVDEGRLDRVSVDRFTPEWKKLLTKSVKPSIGFELGKEVGVFSHLYPEVASIPPETWTHLLKTLDQGAITLKKHKELDEYQRVQVMLSVVGMHLPNPITVAPPIQTFFNRLKFSTMTVKEPTLALVKHGAEFIDAFAKWKEKQITEAQLENECRKALKHAFPATAATLIALDHVLIDERGEPTLSGTEYVEKMTTLIAAHPEWVRNPNQMHLIDGKTLTSRGYKGREIGAIQRWIESKRDAGEITTTEEALAVLPTWKPMAQ